MLSVVKEEIVGINSSVYFLENRVWTLPTRTVLTVGRCFFCSSSSSTSGWTLNLKRGRTEIPDMDKPTSEYIGEVLPPKPALAKLCSPCQEIS